MPKSDFDDLSVREKMPTVTSSEIKIAEQAPAALRVLEKIGRLDVAEILGLTPYMEKAHGQA